MHLVDPKAYAHRLMHPRAWFLESVHRQGIGRDQQPGPSLLDYLEAGVTGTVSSAYTRRRAGELERAFRNGEVSYSEACLEMEQLDEEP